jgi:hypothetical protein
VFYISTSSFSYLSNVEHHNALVNKLTNIKVNMDEEKRITILLCSKPYLWDGVIISLINTSDLNFDSTFNRLLIE